MAKGTRGYRLYLRYSQSELTAMREALCDDPANVETVKNSAYLLNRTTRNKVTDIVWAIYYHLQDKTK